MLIDCWKTNCDGTVLVKEVLRVDNIQWFAAECNHCEARYGRTYTRAAKQCVPADPLEWERPIGVPRSDSVTESPTLSDGMIH